MLTPLKNTRDMSGHSGHAYKHWVRSVPSGLQALGTLGTKLLIQTSPSCKPPYRPVSTPELDSGSKYEASMSVPGRTAAR